MNTFNIHKHAPATIAEWFYQDGPDVRWRRANGKVKAGDIAGTVRDGYRVVKFAGDAIPAPHISFTLANGRHPHGIIDHRDRSRSNNDPENLRELSPGDNNRHRWRGLTEGTEPPRIPVNRVPSVKTAALSWPSQASRGIEVVNAVYWRKAVRRRGLSGTGEMPGHANGAPMKRRRSGKPGWTGHANAETARMSRKRGWPGSANGAAMKRRRNGKPGCRRGGTTETARR